MVSWEREGRSDIISARMCLMQSSSVPQHTPPCKEEQRRDAAGVSICSFVLFSGSCIIPEQPHLSSRGQHFPPVRKPKRCFPPQWNEPPAAGCLPRPPRRAAVWRRPATAGRIERDAVAESAVSARVAVRPPGERAGGGSPGTDRQESLCAGAGVDRVQTLR